MSERVHIPNPTPERIAKALREPIDYEAPDGELMEDIHIRAFEEAKAFVIAYLGYDMSTEDRFESPIMNFVVGMAHVIERERQRASIAEQTAAERLGLAPINPAEAFALLASSNMTAEEAVAMLRQAIGNESIPVEARRTLLRGLGPSLTEVE